MRTALLFLALLLPQALFAQQNRRRLYDALNGAPLAQVLVTNTHTGALWLSDSAGNAAFSAAPGHVVTFSHAGFNTYSIIIGTPSDAPSIALQRAPIELKEVQVRSPLAKYREDSAFARQFFHKELGYAHSQVSMNMGGGGIGAGGLVSQLALIASGKRKQARHLEEAMLYLNELQFSAIRYTPQLVAAQTGLSDSAAEAFIVKNPIPNDYLRVASELELKSRIREAFRAGQKRDSLSLTRH